MSTLFHILRFPILVFFVNVVFDIKGIYYTFLWIDIPMHFAGGASIGFAGITFLAFLRTRGFVSEMPFLLHAFLIMSFVGLAVVSWELWEFVLDYLAHTSTQVDLSDTMIDMFFGLLGGFVLSILHRIR
ncbi:MAG: hypothetical protein Q7S62_00700 [bacterium]|nr:hypothetical protein [bacterium]